MPDVEMTSNMLHINEKDIGNISKYRPLFSSNSQHIHVASGSVLMTYSVETGRCVGQLRGHSEEIVSIQLNPVDQSMLVTCSKDGTVKIWKEEVGICVRTININLHRLGMSFLTGLLMFVNDGAFITGKKIHAGIQLVEYNFLSEEFEKYFEPVLLNNAHNVAIGCRNSVVVAIAETSLYVSSTKDNREKKHMTGERTFSCVDCHKTELCVATGDISGRILVWRNFLDSYKPVKAVYHWHTLPVADIVFSEGNYIYSVGSECVMVKWLLDSQTKNFIPRLGLPIKHVVLSTNQMYSGLTHEDNCLQILDSCNNIVQSIQGLVYRDDKHRGPSVMTFEPRSKSLILNGRPGFLQFYSPFIKKQVCNIDVSNMNFMTNERDKVFVNVDVVLVAVSLKGRWLMTVEENHIQDQIEVILKFWIFNQQTQTWTINTLVDHPHEGRVKSICIQPVDEDAGKIVAISVGEDNVFKVWKLNDITDIYSHKECWSCENIGEYHGYSCETVAFADDSSAFAVSFDSIVTIWNPEDNVIQCTLAHPSITEKIVRVELGHGSSSHFVVCSSDSKLFCWNLVTLSLVWIVDVPTECICACSLSSYMAIFTRDNRVFVFDPCNPTPVYKHSLLSSSPVRAALFIPNTKKESGGIWYEQSTLYFMCEDKRIFALERETDDGYHPSDTASVELLNTPFATLLNQSTKTQSSLKVRNLPLHFKNPTFFKELINSPAHTMPPVRALCHSFLSAMLIPVKHDLESC